MIHPTAGFRVFTLTRVRQGDSTGSHGIFIQEIKARAGSAGTIAWEFLLQWSLVDSLLTKLRNAGQGGVLEARFLTSPAVHIALYVVAIILAIRGILEYRRRGEFLPPPTDRNEVTEGERLWYETAESDPTKEGGLLRAETYRQRLKLQNQAT